VSGQGFVDRIVDDFIDKMVKAIDTGGSDIHGRAFANWFEAF